MKRTVRHGALGLAFVCALFSVFDWHARGAVWWLGAALGIVVAELLSET